MLGGISSGRDSLSSRVVELVFCSPFETRLYPRVPPQTQNDFHQLRGHGALLDGVCQVIQRAPVILSEQHRERDRECQCHRSHFTIPLASQINLVHINIEASLQRSLNRAYRLGFQISLLCVVLKYIFVLMVYFILPGAQGNGSLLKANQPVKY